MSPRFARLLPTLCALLAVAAGCDTRDEPTPFGLDSIESVDVRVSHHTDDDGITVSLYGKLTPATGNCPALAEDFAISVNGTPMQLSLYDPNTHNFTLGCTISDLEAYATLPTSGGPLLIQLSEGGRQALIRIADSTWPTLGPVSVSSTSAPIGGSFTIDVPASPAHAATGVANSGCWLAWICSDQKPSCEPGYGYFDPLTIMKVGMRGDEGFTIDVQVPPYATPGHNRLTLDQSLGCEPPLVITECSGLPLCYGTNHPSDWVTFGPFDFEVL